MGFLGCLTSGLLDGPGCVEANPVLGFVLLDHVWGAVQLWCELPPDQEVNPFSFASSLAASLNVEVSTVVGANVSRTERGLRRLQQLKTRILDVSFEVAAWNLSGTDLRGRVRNVTVVGSPEFVGFQDAMRGQYGVNVVLILDLVQPHLYARRALATTTARIRLPQPFYEGSSSQVVAANGVVAAAFMSALCCIIVCCTAVGIYFKRDVSKVVTTHRSARYVDTKPAKLAGFGLQEDRSDPLGRSPGYMLTDGSGLSASRQLAAVVAEPTSPSCFSSTLSSPPSGRLVLPKPMQLRPLELPTPYKAAVRLCFVVHKAEYAQLVTNPGARGAFERVVMEVLCEFAAQEGVRPPHVQLRLSPGSVVVSAVVTPPGGPPYAEALAARLRGTTALRDAVEARLRLLRLPPEICDLGLEVGPVEVDAAPPMSLIPLERVPVDAGQLSIASESEEYYSEAADHTVVDIDGFAEAQGGLLPVLCGTLPTSPCACQGGRTWTREEEPAAPAPRISWPSPPPPPEEDMRFLQTQVHHSGCRADAMGFDLECSERTAASSSPVRSTLSRLSEGGRVSDRSGVVGPMGSRDSGCFRLGGSTLLPPPTFVMPWEGQHPPVRDCFEFKLDCT